MNHFDPTLSNEAQLRQLIRNESKGVEVDADAIIAALSRWVGWYRMETSPPLNKSARDKHDEADAIIASIAKLYAQLNGMSPDLRCQVREAMRRAQVEAPDLARLHACFTVAKGELVEPRQGQQSNIPARDNALRRVREAVILAAPALKAGAADQLAAALLREAKYRRVPEDPEEHSVIPSGVPEDPKELRRILRG